jgi:uncharacterized protein involved in exopolysaccharide biosynthesis
VKVSQKSLEFIDAELERISQRMTEVEAKVATIKAENPGRLPEDLAANQRSLDRLSSEISRGQRQFDMASSDEAFWRSQMLAAETLERPNDDASPTRKLQLLELLIAEQQARGFTEKHPDYLRAKQELEVIRQALAMREADRENVESDLPPNYQQQIAEAERKRAELQAVSAQGEIDRLQARAESFRTLLAETPRVAEQLDGLGRQYQSQLDSYQLYIRRQQEASVQADMERRQLGEQFRVLEAAFIAPQPSSPNRPLILVLALFFAAAVAAGTAVMLEVTDASVHDARQIQGLMNLPVLASIPQIWLESDRILRRRKLVRQALASVALVMFVLVGGAANYTWVNGMPGFVEDLLSEDEEIPGSGSDAAAGTGG